MGPTIFMEVYALYMTSHPWFMTSQHYPFHQSIISHIKLNISDNTSTASLYSHPIYRSYIPHCVYDNTGTICMTSCEYIWHHIHSLWYHTTLWHSHALYSCHHTQDTRHCIHCSWAITYSLLIIACLQHVLYQTTICIIIWILWDITTTLSDIKRLYSCHHIHTIPEYRHTVYDMTYTTLVTSQPL